MLKKGLVIIVLMGFILSLSACNTIRGVGKDIQKGGEVIEKIAQ